MKSALTTRFALALIAVLCGATLPPIPAPAQIVPLGDAFAVNADPAGDAREPAVAVGPAGDFTVVWTSDRDTFPSITGRRFSAAGQALGGDLAIEPPDEFLSSPSIAAFDSGFVVAWSTRHSDVSLRLRRFDPAGLPAGDLEPVLYSIVPTSYPTVAAFPAGQLVLSWTRTTGTFSGDQVEAREYDASGLTGAEFQVSEGGLSGFGYGDQRQSQVALGPNGRFVVVWHDQVFDFDPRAVYARRFEYGTGALGSELRVDPEILPSDAKIAGRPRVAMDEAGRFLVVWESRTQGGGTGFDVWARLYASSGVPLGEAFRVNDLAEGDQRTPDLAMDRKGNAAVVWRDDPGGAIRGRLLNRRGEPQRGDFEIASAQPSPDCVMDVFGARCQPVVALNESDIVLVAWESSGIDGQGSGIAGRFFDASFETDCQPGPRTLCLQDRFRVEVDWQVFSGGTGPGRVVPAGTSDSGLFWFFSSNNWEMLVKVLDGCDINQHYWVFAAASTAVAYTLTVTDTLTDEIRTYENPLGIASPAITDTAAFATCDP